MILTIDIGGTKVLVATFSLQGQLLKSKKIKTSPNYPSFLEELTQLIQEIIGYEQPVACAIALPGTLDREKGIAIGFGNLDWENITIAQDLSKVLTCPIYIENDAKMAALSEASELQEHYKRVLYVTVSTGIGLGLVVDGKIDHSVSDLGGKAIMLEHQGKIMAWEEFASGRAIVAKTGKMASELDDPADWYMIARNIAIGLINLISVLGPDCIIIGGGVGAHLEKFQEKLFNELEIYQNHMLQMPIIRKAQHPEQAVIYGGYILATQKLS